MNEHCTVNSELGNNCNLRKSFPFSNVVQVSAGIELILHSLVLLPIPPRVRRKAKVG